MTTKMWFLWALLLLAQNFAFTFVSRARNSGSLSRHMVSAVFSNGIWFCSQLFAVSAFMNILSGKYGTGRGIFAAVFYTVFTLTGSLLAHYYALNTEKGKTAVGANSKYAQITKQEWEEVKNTLYATSER
jgi:hypothetical protein